jgi:putative phage-type endonuclease
MAELIVERLTGVPQDTFQSLAMLHGIETEPLARAAYAFLTDTEVVEVGIVKHPTIAWAHASPDGLVGNPGLIEIKCPMSSTHIDTLLGAATPDKYIVQMQWQMACCGRAWCDWCSFDPRLPAAMQLHVRRVARDDKRIASLEKDVTDFLAELDEKLANLTRLYSVAEAAAA